MENNQIKTRFAFTAVPQGIVLALMGGGSYYHFCIQTAEELRIFEESLQRAKSLAGEYCPSLLSPGAYGAGDGFVDMDPGISGA